MKAFQTRLHLARAFWFVCALASAAILVLSIPGYLTSEPLGTLGEHLVLNTTPGFLVVSRLATVVSFVSALLSLVLAALIFWQRPGDGFALFVSFYLLTNGALVAGPIEMLEVYGLETAAFNSFVLLPLLQGPMAAALLALFPDGRFVPRWTRWLLLLTFLFAPVTLYLYPDRLYAVAGTPFVVLLTAAWLGTVGALIYAQYYRYHFVASPPQRQQTKWAVYGFALSILTTALASITWGPALALPPGTVMPWWVAPGALLFALGTIFVPLTLSMAVLRYRLWEIDALINRALVYGLLTVLLATTYLGSVLLLQPLVAGLSGREQTPLVTVASTLLIAALFQPLRRAIQQFIDRRFFRRKYDAAEALAAFGAAARDEMELEELTRALLDVIDETMQPAQISIWLYEEL